MVYFSAFARVAREDSKCLVERASYKFLSMRGKVDTEDGIYMVFVNDFDFIKFTHVKSVAVSVFVPNGEIEGFVGVPAHT